MSGGLGAEAEEEEEEGLCACLEDEEAGTGRSAKAARPRASKSSSVITWREKAGSTYCIRRCICSITSVQGASSLPLAPFPGTTATT